jgi:hypothetical protein
LLCDCGRLSQQFDSLGREATLDIRALPDDDMPQLLAEIKKVVNCARSVQCHGIGPTRDGEDGSKGFGAHSDQEHILQEEPQKFVRFHWDIVVNLAKAR